MPIAAFGYLDINHPVVAWNVYRGILVSAETVEEPSSWPVSLMFAGIVYNQNNTWLQSELVIEAVRSQRFPSRVSRLAGMYFFTDPTEALKAQEQKWGGHFQKDNLAELELYSIGEVTRVDSNWITYAKRDETAKINPSEINWIDSYWSGQVYNDSPVWETIIHGRAIVFGTELRKRAYEVVAKRFPKCLETLERSRIAAAVGSDLGRITPFITQPSPKTFRLVYTLDMRDANNPDFLKRFWEYDGPRNFRDLASDEDTFLVPDLRNLESEFTINALVQDGKALFQSIHRI